MPDFPAVPFQALAACDAAFVSNTHKTSLSVVEEN